MFESLFFITFFFIGAFFMFVSLIIYVVGGISRSKKIIRIGHWSSILPLFFFGTIFFYYGVIVPYGNKVQKNRYAKTYIYRQKGMKNELQLKTDGTFTCRCSSRVDIPYKGTWESGGIDGVLMFYDEDGVLVQYGMPAINYEEKKVISFSDRPDHEITFVEKSF